MGVFGAEQGGVRTIEDVRDRSVIDAETGCWVVRGRRDKGSMILWMPAARQVLTLTAAMAWLITGEKAKPGTMWVAMCGNSCCGNPEHRQLGDRSLLMRIKRPTLDPAHRAKIQQAQLKRSKAYAPEVRAEIMASNETGEELAKRLGIDRSVVSKVRRGQTWTAAAPGSSVFNWAGQL